MPNVIRVGLELGVGGAVPNVNRSGTRCTPDGVVVHGYDGTDALYKMVGEVCNCRLG